jgi:hypothetical protein
MTHKHTCPECGHTWECFGYWSDKQKIRTEKTCEKHLGLKTNGGRCDLCWHLNMAENVAIARFPTEGDPLAHAMFQRYLRRQKKLEEAKSKDQSALNA